MTVNLKLKDIDAATEAKHRLEEKQRAEARERKEKEIQWETRVSLLPVSQCIVASSLHIGRVVCTACDFPFLRTCFWKERKKIKQFRVPEVCLTGFFCLVGFFPLPCSCSMRMANAGFTMNLFWREWHHYDTSTASVKQPSLRKELFYNSPFMWSLGMTDEWTFKQLCILEMNDKNRLYTSNYQIKQILLSCQLHHFHAPLLL